MQCALGGLSLYLPTNYFSEGDLQMGESYPERLSHNIEKWILGFNPGLTESRIQAHNLYAKLKHADLVPRVGGLIPVLLHCLDFLCPWKYHSCNCSAEILVRFMSLQNKHTY